MEGYLPLQTATINGHEVFYDVQGCKLQQIPSTALRISMRRQHRRKCRCLPAESDTRHTVPSAEVFVLEATKYFMRNAAHMGFRSLKKVIAPTASTYGRKDEGLQEV
jgi:hypothetical protein